MGNTNYPVLLTHSFAAFAAAKACDERGEACTEAMYKDVMYLKFIKKKKKKQQHEIWGT